MTIEQRDDRYDTAVPVDPNVPKIGDLSNTSKALAGSREIVRTDTEGKASVPIYVVDGKRLDTGKKKVPAIYVHCEVGAKNFMKSHTFALHEIPLVRRLHRDSGGDVTIFTTGYAPGLKQVVWFTEFEAHDELRRLAGDTNPDSAIQPKYVLPSRGTEPPRNIFPMVYGEGRDGATRFFLAMRDMAVAWDLLMKRMERGYTCTSEDVWEILDIADPRMVISTIDMPSMPEVKGFNEAADTHRPKTEEASKPVDTVDADRAMLHQFLLGEHVPEEFAAPFAREYIAAKGNPLTDEAWVRVLGPKAASKETKSMRARLMELLELYLAPSLPR